MGTSSLRAAEAASQLDFLPAPYRNTYYFFTTMEQVKLRLPWLPNTGIVTPPTSDKSGALRNKKRAGIQHPIKIYPGWQSSQRRSGSRRLNIPSIKKKKNCLIKVKRGWVEISITMKPTDLALSLCCGSVTFRYGDGPADPYHWLTDPDPFFSSSVADKMTKSKFFFRSLFA
jgi:hypothetical protein